MDSDNAETGKQQQSGRGRRRQRGNWKRFAAEHIVDDHLQRPRLQELEAGDQEDLRKRPGDPPPIRPQIGQKFRQQNQTVRGALIGNGALASGSTGISGIGLATASMMRCISLRNPTSCQTIATELISPAVPIAAAVSGQPRIIAKAVSAAQLRSRNDAKREKRIAQRTRSSRFAPPWFSVQTRTNARLHKPREIFRSQLLQPVSGTTKYFCGTRNSIKPPISASFSVPASLQ